MEDDNVQLSKITQMILKHYNREFDTYQKENNALCVELNNERNLAKTYGSSILGINNLSEQNFNKIINDKIKEIDDRNTLTDTQKNFKCNFDENNKRIADVINSKNNINFIEDQEFMYKVIKYRRLEVIKQLVYFKKTVAIFKYLCISEKNLTQKGVDITKITENKIQTTDILKKVFLGNEEGQNPTANNMLKETLCKYLFLTTNFYKIIPKHKYTKEQQKWNEEWDKLIGKGPGPGPGPLPSPIPAPATELPQPPSSVLGPNAFPPPPGDDFDSDSAEGEDVSPRSPSL
jgi:hypothetical protein